MRLVGLFLPHSKSGLVFLALLTVAAAIRLLGDQRAAFGPYRFSPIELVWLLGLTALAFFLVPRGAERVAPAPIVVASVALLAAGWPLAVWRTAIIEPTPSLAVAISRASDVTGRIEQRVILDSLDLDQRRYLSRLTGRQHDMALEISGYLLVPRAGTYRFHLDCDDSCRIRLEGRWLTPRRGSSSIEAELDSGVHLMLIRYRQTGGPARMRIDWDQPKIIELLSLSHYVSGRPASLNPASLRRKEVETALSLSVALIWWVCVFGLVLKIGEMRESWKAAVSTGPAARWAPAVLATVFIVYGALLRLDALLVHSRLIIENQTAESIHRWLRPAFPNYGLLNAENAPEDPYRADVRSYLDRAAKLSPGGFYQASFREPFYVALVKLFVALTGGRQIGVLIQSFVFSIATLPIFYILSSRLAGRWWALGVLVPVVLHEWLALESPTGYRMSAYSFFLLGFTGWAFLREKKKGWVGPVVAGILAATVCLTRLSGLSFVVPLLMLKACSKPVREGAKYALISFVVLSVLVVPFMLSCYMEHGDPFYSVSFHTRFWLDAEDTASGPAGSVGVLQYLTDYHEWGTLVSGTLKGLTTLPLRTFWNGLARFPLLDAMVMAAGISGLLLVLPTPFRFLTVAYFGHLIPFAYIQNFPSGTMPRFVMPAYFFLALAAVLACRWLNNRVTKPKW